jgi:predicted transcriptional regulator
MNKVLPLATATETDDPNIVLLDADSVDWDDPEIDPEFRAAVMEGIASADAGQLIDIERVIEWVESWDSDNELPMPTCE